MVVDDDAGPCTLKPCRNMTATYFELGRYTSCREMTERVIEIIKENMPEDKVILAKLAQRVQRSIEHIPQVSEQEKLKRRLKISASLPRYRASMYTTMDYFTVGHDIAESVFNDLPQNFPREDDKTMSFFLGGIGDARHFYATMIDLHASEKKGIAPRRKYHFVANDLNKCALTRDLIIWKLLDELSTLAHDSDQGLMALATIFFIYESYLIPKYIHENLRAIMENILVILEKGDSPLPWVSLHAHDIPKYIEVLKHWICGDFENFTTSKVMQGIQIALSQRPLFPDQNCKKEKQMYAKYGFLRPPEKTLLSLEPILWELIKTPSKYNGLRGYIQKNWIFNPTMMDLDWYKDLQRRDRSEAFDFGNDPFDALGQFESFYKGQKPSSLFDHVAPLFKGAADAIKKMKQRLHVEVLCGDVIEIAEWLRYNISPTRVPRSEKFPTEFDLIHLSNIPDYIGGHLSTFLYITPIMKFVPSSILQSNCLRNAGSWDSIEAFLADYQCITDKEMLRQLTGVSVVNEPLKDTIFPLIGYNWYTPALPIFQGDWSVMLPRNDFQKWFYALFFRLALPYNVDIIDIPKIIFSPLNLTILFRLIDQLRSLHYPSHWMSEILLNIIENKVVTNCRPPRISPNPVSALKQQHKTRSLCTVPFSHEMATLTRLFIPLLPFTLKSSAIPAQSDIFRYTFPLPSFMSDQEWPSNLTLVFWSHTCLEDLGDLGFKSFAIDIRPFLDPTWGDEMDSKFKGSKFDAFRNNGLVVWSTVEWDIEAREASAWMPSALVDKMIREIDWTCGLFRTDTWERCWALPCMVIDARKGEAWRDDITSAADRQLVDFAKQVLDLESQE
ncbi:hypothetical protein OCU04_003385 [Sclerotinia nivalis]|nr:hypothetical protein OCU04_003385 [Sclerotinia nivalis]